MDVPVTTQPELSPVSVHHPLRQTVPLIVASPHSGRDYPADFISTARLDPLSLRRSEDCFVDELFADAPGLGAPLLTASFPRAFCDPNREKWELDPTMFEEALPPWVNTTSARVGAGLGTIPRVVASGEAIYAGKLRFKEAQRRVETYWEPYHDTLAALISGTRALFGACLLLDCHSMPAQTGPGAGPRRGADMVLGRCSRHRLCPTHHPLHRAGPGRTGLHGPAQRSLCRRLYHAKLRPPAGRRACGPARNRPWPVHERGEDRAPSTLRVRAA